MSKENQSQAQTINEQISVLQFHGSNIAFEEINGKMMVNATQMAKAYGKKPDNWLRTQQAKDLAKVLAVSHICETKDLQVVRQGGKNQGTWLHEELALIFAQWLSPEFYLACNRKLKELLTKQALILPAKKGVTPLIHEQQFLYNYNEALLSMGASIKGSTSKRKAKHPQHFFKIFGRNFITSEYFDLLQGYYNYKNSSNQLALSL